MASTKREVRMDAIAHGLGHPLRRRLLVGVASVNTAGGVSPTELAKRYGEPLTNVSYHVRQLLETDLIRLVDTSPRRGALEHFYRLTSAGRKAITVLDCLREVAK